ncbi:MAG: antibiotic biosynthesis monooxygenase [bacterium]
MHIVHVYIHVKSQFLEDFISATLENAANSIAEPGILRFDFMQQADDPERFTLIEIYRTPEDQAAHRETAHYQKWRDKVAPMMAESRIGIKQKPIFIKDFPE